MTEHFRKMVVKISYHDQVCGKAKYGGEKVRMIKLIMIHLQFVEII